MNLIRNKKPKSSTNLPEANQASSTVDNKHSLKGGYLLVQVLVFGAIAIVVIGGLISFAIANIKLGHRMVLSEQSFQMAEAGLEYYRWHLAHDPADYTDGTGEPGPYVKNFYDKDGILIGTFSLDIESPLLGSTLVTIESTGVPEADASVNRTILSRLAIPSFANFAVAANSFMRFGPGTEIFGPVHSNDGIRFDGLVYNLVTSALTSFNDPGHTGSDEFAVHTHVNPPPETGISTGGLSSERPPNPVPSRPDVFIAGRSFPSPEVQFIGITADVEQIEEDAKADGFYRATSTTGYGFRLVLKTDNTFDLYVVNSLQGTPGSCSSGQTGWGTWSIDNSTLLGNYPYPENGLMFFGDHLWVEGQIDGERLSIVAANLPDTPTSARKSITVNNDLLYTNYDGTDVIALIAQNNINAGLFSANDLRIDAALIAQNGRVGRYSYSQSGCGSTRFRDSITLYGTIITAQQYGFTYTGSNHNCGAGIGTIGNGYCSRNIIYDAFLLYNPPPFFPKTEDFHEVLFWKEI
jgi:hypothetical protein